MSVTGAEYVDKVLFVNPLVMFPLSIGEMREVKETQEFTRKSLLRKLIRFHQVIGQASSGVFPLA